MYAMYDLSINSCYSQDIHGSDIHGSIVENKWFCEIVELIIELVRKKLEGFISRKNNNEENLDFSNNYQFICLELAAGFDDL